MFRFTLFPAFCSAVVSSLTCKYLVKVYGTWQLCASGARGVEEELWPGVEGNGGDGTAEREKDRTSWSHLLRGLSKR